MPRAPRLQAAGELYHVTARGNRQHPTFLQVGDYAKFLELLADTAARHRWRCYAYCLMPNHIHLVVRPLEATLSAGVQRLNGGYAQWFNRRHDLSGHVFQGRFHSVLVESEAHLIELARYVLRNPVRARLCGDASQWPWSSFGASVGRTSAPAFLALDDLLPLFGSGPATARANLEDFVLRP